MTLSISQTYSAIGPHTTSSFLGSGGVKPYVYSVVPGGAGGTINSKTGVYTSPQILDSSPTKAYDIVKVTDSTAAIATSRILVGNALLLFCDVIQKEMGLADGRVYVYDQKIFQPTDYDLYIAVTEAIPKPFGNNRQYATDSDNVYKQFQSVNMQSMLDIDAISRGPSARDRKEEIIMALNSTYSEQQQEANAFFIGNISTHFLNLSNVDGAAIPYRFKISCMIQYCKTKITPVNYYDKFQTPALTVSTN